MRHRFSIDLVPFQPAHVAAAAALVAARYRGLLALAPALPLAWSDETALARILGELVARGSGVAAVRDGELVAFQAATVLDGHGGRWSYTPDIGHAIAVMAPAEADRLIGECYAQLAAGWVRDACSEHVVTVMADDAPARRAFSRLGFGESVVDLVRGLEPLDVPRLRGLEIRRATTRDAAAIAELDRALGGHLSGSPVFRRMGPARSAELQRRELDDPAIATFIAETGTSVVAFLRIGPPATDVATIVRDRGTASITAAYTEPDRRGLDIASGLLAAGLRWALESGYVRVAVDHESANGEAARFWARHCEPVAVSLARRLPPSTVA